MTQRGGGGQQFVWSFRSGGGGSQFGPWPSQDLGPLLGGGLGILTEQPNVGGGDPFVSGYLVTQGDH